MHLPVAEDYQYVSNVVLYMIVAVSVNRNFKEAAIFFEGMYPSCSRKNNTHHVALSGCLHVPCNLSAFPAVRPFSSSVPAMLYLTSQLFHEFRVSQRFHIGGPFLRTVFAPNHEKIIDSPCADHPEENQDKGQRQGKTAG